MLRPDVLATDRLLRWRPAASAVPSLITSIADLERRLFVMSHGWAVSTLSTYGWALLLYHVWCDSRSLAESSRAPVSMATMSTFISDLVGSYSASALKNVIAGIHAWHDLHGLKWKANDRMLSLLLKGAAEFVPENATREKREPVLVEHLEKIIGILDPDAPFDAAFGACLLTVFWGTARLGEFVVPTSNPGSFDPLRHVKRCDATPRHDINNNTIFEFWIPRTKSAHAGELVCWARRTKANPEEAYLNHLRVNDPPSAQSLFAFRTSVGADEWQHMTRHRFLARLGKACDDIGIRRLHGHGLRIGGTLALLLEGMPFETVKIKGRWKSDAFQLYLRRHGAVLASHIQEPDVARELIRYTLPPVR